ncbi:hypothetical protein LY78DRAFT_651255 [Colletotrichum sublineola]|nr:hypothetical protein LY78DRAFT_651255 [Colletotrichum sublineola]
MHHACSRPILSLFSAPTRRSRSPAPPPVCSVSCAQPNRAVFHSGSSRPVPTAHHLGKYRPPPPGYPYSLRHSSRLP